MNKCGTITQEVYITQESLKTKQSSSHDEIAENLFIIDFPQLDPVK